MEGSVDHAANILFDTARSRLQCAVIGVSQSGQITSWCDDARASYGYSADEVIGRPLSALYPDDQSMGGSLERLLEDAAKSSLHMQEAWQVTQGGTRFPANLSIIASEGRGGVGNGYTQITRPSFAPSSLCDPDRERERLFTLLVQGVSDYAIFMLSQSGHVASWNAGAARIKGYAASDILGEHYSRFYTPEDALAGLPQRALEIAAREGRFETEGWRMRQDGTRFWVHAVIDAIYEDGALVGFAKITRDITERREASEALEKTRAALLQAQKMEAIGKLTGGVAHDFNNVLQILRGNLELLEPRIAGDARAQSRLDHAIDAVERGSKLASQLLAFGRKQPLRPDVVNLSRLLRGIDELLRGALDETISLETVVAGGLWNTVVDAHQLENVLLNLAINARDAMPDGGKLTLEVSNAMLDDRYVASQLDLRPGQYVLLAVTDTGVGMSAEVAERAFEPFFTTKPEGVGTGLGLSTAYGFIKQSDGHIRIYSELGHGTTVKIYLPRSCAEETEVMRSPTGPVLGGDETILVVEDDVRVQATAVDLLTQLGYRVLKADDPQSALPILRSGIPIDLLFTDVVMPGNIRSPELAKRAKHLIPGIKVLYTSGYTQNAIVHGGRLDPGVELLGKPYRREDLARKVRRILDSPDSPATFSATRNPPGKVGYRLSVLVVEDVEDARVAVCELLSVLGHAPVGVGSAERALELLVKQTFDVLMTDVSLPGISGLDLIQTAKLRWPGLRAIVMTGHHLEDLPVADTGIGFLRKPYGLDELQNALSVMTDTD